MTKANRVVMNKKIKPMFMLLASITDANLSCISTLIAMFY